MSRSESQSDGLLEPPCDATEAASALADLSAVVDRLAAIDPLVLAGTDLLDSTVELDRQVTRLHAVRGRRLATIAHTDAHTLDGCVTTTSWWRMRTRRDHAAASRHVTTAVRIAQMRELSAALDDGDITSDHANVIARAMRPHRAEHIRAAERTLTELARNATPQDLRTACQRLADLVDRDGTQPEVTDPDGSEPDANDPDTAPEHDHERQTGGLHPDRGFTAVRTWQGMVRVEGDLDPITGERLLGLLDAASTPDPPDTPPDRRRTARQRRHDAFDRILRAAETVDDLPTVHGAAPHVLASIDLLTILGAEQLATRRPRLASGVELTVEQALDLLADAKLTPILQLGPWRTVAVGRTHRTLPAWLRTVLAITHRHCRGPGCDRPFAWSQAAHLDAWAPGGHTDLDRTLPLCHGHHRLLDLAGWTAEYDPDRNVATWTSPDRTRTWTSPPPEP